jgi:exodeoxyribonuclease-3
VKLATWNVNSLMERMPRLLEFLDQHRPDLMFLQETRIEPDDFPHEELAEVGYHAAHHSAGRQAGVALLAPDEVLFAEECAGLQGEPTRDEARWLEATVKGVRAVSVYVPNGREVGSDVFADKLRFLEAAAERIRELASGPLIVAGDFNVGETHVTPEERQRFFKVLEAGVVDAYRALHPDKVGLRTVFTLLSPPLAERLETCGIDRNFREGPEPSDHAPLLTELRDA